GLKRGLHRGLAELGDVGAGDERAPGADDHDRLHRSVGDGLLDPVVQSLAHVLAQRVDGRVVDGEHGHAAAGAEVYGLGDLRHVCWSSERLKGSPRGATATRLAQRCSIESGAYDTRERPRRAQQPSWAARSPKSLATTSHSRAGFTSFACPGPCSAGRGTNAVRRPTELAAARSPLCAATIMHSPGASPSSAAVVRYASGCGL